MSKAIKAEDLSSAIADELKIYSKGIREQVDEEARKSAEELVVKTKATAPVGKRRKHYKNSISMKEIRTVRTSTYVWYVKGPDYRLSHLLEKGHALRNGGRVEGTHFIKNAAGPIIRDYEEKVKEIIKNG